MMGKTSTKSFRSLLSAVMLLAPLLLLRSSSNAFSISSTTLPKTQTCGGRRIASSSHFFTPANHRTATLQRPAFHGAHDENTRTSKSWSSSTTSLSMYNLPPGGGGSGGGGDKNEILDIAKGAGSLLLVVGFFVSPLGGFVLGIFNSFLILAFVLPILATVGFQVWSSLNLVKGECPNCSAPVTVMKNKDNGSNVVDGAMPTANICFNCGASLQANEDNTGINNVSGRTSIDDLNSPTEGASIFDLFSSPPTTTTTATPTTTSFSKKDNKPGIDKSSVIDVDVLDEDKPFQ